MQKSYSISPDSHARPCPKLVEETHGVLPGLRVRHVPDELVALQEAWQCLQAGNLEAQSCGFEAVGTRGVGRHGIGDNVAITNGLDLSNVTRRLVGTTYLG
jgi:hypothetical protein